MIYNFVQLGEALQNATVNEAAKKKKRKKPPKIRLNLKTHLTSYM